MSGEFDFIAWLRSQTPGHERILIGPGDDCAVLSPFQRPALVTTDMLMDEIDFQVATIGPRRAGRKAMAANLSDLAAMAGRPIAAFISVALPRSAGQVFAQELYLGCREIADEFGTAIAGGDTNSWDGLLAISITVLGETTERGAVTRAGAKPGDWLFVTGPLGGSILGHHLDFTPRIREALALHAAVDLHAMCDISDGLSADLHHILEASRCGAVLDADRIPIAPAARELSRTSGKTALQHALTDGEDFELVFSASPGDGEQLQQKPPVPGLERIGVCVESGLWLNTNGVRTPLTPEGWTHPLG